MTHFSETEASDGHRFRIYRAEPENPARGVLVVAPEIFGVNSHIRSVADGWANEGFLTLAPQLFDRTERDYEAAYETKDVSTGIELMQSIAFDDALADIAATLRSVDTSLPCAIVGYCWGGTLAWLAAARLAEVKASVSYYGGGIPDFMDEQPHCPLMLHFAKQDDRPSLAQAMEIAELNPQAEAHFYNAGHGFNCDQRPGYDAEASALARSRSLEFLTQSLTVD